ncbi:MAG: hypothetical protein ACRD7E_10320 [Bryobacteraceae bacterium]
MKSKSPFRSSRVLKLLAGALLAVSAWGASPFGKVVAIGGHASDLALDEGRGVLYIANFTANRIDVMSLADKVIQTSMNVAAQPNSLSLSPDGKYLVATHYGNFEAPTASKNGLTVVNLETGGKQTFALGSAPLGVAFGIDNQAFIATVKEFLLFDPVLGTTQVLDTIEGVVAKTLPQPAGSFPTNITTASIAASRDGLWIFGGTDKLNFRYDVRSRRVNAQLYTSTPENGPRAVSVSDNGEFFTSGWSLQDRDFALHAQFPNPAGTLNIGSTAIDSSRRLIYAQMPEAAVADSSTPAPTTPPAGSTTVPAPPPAAEPSANTPPVLQVVEAENLAVREKLLLPENLAGKSVLSSDYGTMYAVSDSGVVVLPIGSIEQARKLSASHEDVVFRGNFCDRQAAVQEITIVDTSGASTDFGLSSSSPAVHISPSSGVTPARVRISVDPSAFQNSGTAAVMVEIKSDRAVNLPSAIRVLVNTRGPDQRGTFVNVPGKLVDILPDPTRDRFFIIRQDKNQVLVFDSGTTTPVATLQVGNTPTQMAITFDRRYLLVGSDNSQIIYVFDLETLEPVQPIRMPPGHYPRSIAVSGRAILVASRVAGPKHQISRVDFASRTAVVLPTLGVYDNDINIDTVLVASPNGSSILAAQADGNVLLYNASADTFTVSRKDSTALAGAYAASSFDRFVVGNMLMNASLVPMHRLETGTGRSSGFAFVGDEIGYRLTAPDAQSPGVMQRVDLQNGNMIRATRMVEAPILNDPELVFTRTIAPLHERRGIVALTTSGFTVFPWNYDTSVAPPRIESVVNAADLSAPVAPGGLVSVLGSELSPVNMSSSQVPLPTALGESCLTVNGVPVPMIFVSPRQVNAQLPFAVEGNTTLVLRTPGGVSDNYSLTIQPAAPSVFRTGIAGPDSDIPAVVRARNNAIVTPSNPIHLGDVITIYATGLGKTSPAVDPGFPAPSEPLAYALIPPVVTLGGVDLLVTYAGLTPGEVGIYQINAVIGDDVPLGLSVPLSISQGSEATSMNVRVVK